MNQRKNPASWLVAFLVALAGCSGAAPVAPVQSGDTKEKPGRTLDFAVDAMREAENTASFREALDRINSYVNQADVRLELSAADHEVLSKRFGLTKDEIGYLSERTFRPLDCNYLEGCFLLRDAARSVEQPAASPVQQAGLAIAWVNRQVLLAEHQPSLLPAQFVLERGVGNTWERGVVFVELLRQLGMDGCIVTVNQGGKEAVYGGAIIPAKEGSDVCLMDVRLGQPLFNEANQVETLAGLRKKSTEIKVFVAAPLPALSPRMKHLHDQLAIRNQVALAVQPAAYLTRLDKAARQQVEVWTNRQTPSGAPKISPLFGLRDIMAPSEQGTNQVRNRLTAARIPWVHISGAYSDLRLTPPHLDAEASTRLNLATRVIYDRFVTAPRGFLLRGQYERIILRLEGIRHATEDFQLDGKFTGKVNEWREKVNEARVKVNRAGNDPELRNAMVANLEAIWNEDQYFAFLLTKDGVPKVTQEGGDFRDVLLPKGMLSLIVLSAMHAPLDQESGWLFAQMWQEKAESAQGELEGGKLAGAKLARARDKARSAWINSEGQWRRYVDGFYFGSPGAALNPQAQARLTMMGNSLRGRDFAAGLSWSQLLLDYVMKGAQARLSLAHAQRRLGEPETSLQELIDDLDELQQNTALADALKNGKSAPNPDYASAFRGMENDFTGDGALHWLREQARTQLRK